MTAQVEATRTMPQPPLRGTQSFVGVMARVWNRPTLLLLEVCWRWLAAVPLLWLAWRAGSRALRGVPFDGRSLQAMTVFKPTEAAAALQHQAAVSLPPLLPVARWWLPVALLVWAAASAWGRTAIWRRLDPQLRPRYGAVGVLGLTRAVALIGFFGLWAWGLIGAARITVTSPAAAGREPNLVLLVALAVALTLALFMLWSLLSWVLDAAPLFLMQGPRRVPTKAGTTLPQSVHAAWKARVLRAKLVETNLVMGIIKVALLVLALVFSACPLPFASEETAGFLALWWSFVGLLYLVFSDLFQVIRRAAFLRLFEAIVTPEGDIAHLRKEHSR